jgi:hypothetical protein
MPKKKEKVGKAKAATKVQRDGRRAISAALSLAVPKNPKAPATKKRKKTAKTADMEVPQPKVTIIPKAKDQSIIKSTSPMGIFPEEVQNRLSNLFGSGLDRVGRSHAKTVSSLSHSSLAMPTYGGTSVIPAAPEGFQSKLTAAQKKKGTSIAAANVQMLQPFFHTPGNAQDAYGLPKSYAEQIRWSRLMYNLNPYIHSITELKAYYGYSRFKLSTPEPWVTSFFESVAFSASFNLYRFILRMALSYQKFGEAIVWGARKQDGTWPKTGMPKWVWDYFILLEPELVEVKKQMVGNPQPQYFMRPSRDMEELVSRLRSNDPEVEHLQGTIAEPIMKKIEKRELVQMDASTVSSIQNLTDGSATRGTPPYQALFVNFIFEDFVRLALMAQANRYHFPIEVWTLGNLEKGILPTLADLQKLRDMVADAIMAPPFAIFFPPLLEYKAYGVDGQLASIKENMEYAHKQYLIGMGVNESMVMGDTTMFGSSETAGNQAFIRARKKERDEMEEWARQSFFGPLCEWNGIKMEKAGELKPILPDMEWEKTLDFKAEEDERKRMQFLFEKGLLDPEAFIVKYGGLNPEDIKVAMAKQIGGILDDGKRFGNPAVRAQVSKERGLKESGPSGGDTGQEAAAVTGPGEEGAGGGGGAAAEGAPPEGGQASAGGGEEEEAPPEAGAEEAGGGAAPAEPAA